jgi:hypothetical protein
MKLFRQPESTNWIDCTALSTDSKTVSNILMLNGMPSALLDSYCIVTISLNPTFDQTHELHNSAW